MGQAVGKTSEGLDAVTHPLYCQSPPAHDTYNPRAQLWSKDAGEDKNKHISFKSVYAGVTLCVTSRTQFVWLIWATCDASTGKDLPTNTRPKRPMAAALLQGGSLADLVRELVRERRQLDLPQDGPLWPDVHARGVLKPVEVAPVVVPVLLPLRPLKLGGLGRGATLDLDLLPSLPPLPACFLVASLISSVR